MSAFFLFHMSHENFTVKMTVTCDFSEKCEILREILMRKRKRSEMDCFSEKARTLERARCALPHAPGPEPYNMYFVQMILPRQVMPR